MPARIVLFALLALTAFVAIAGIALFQLSPEDGEGLETLARRAGLEPLPEGQPRAMGTTAAIDGASLDDMIRRADIVFIGRAADVGASEPVGAQHGSSAPLTAHRTRFRVTRVLRGSDTEVMDVSLLDFDELMGAFELGRTYLVFADRRQLGESRVPALIPSGYDQGAYVITGDDTARNRYNGTVSIRDLERRMGDRVDAEAASGISGPG